MDELCRTGRDFVPQMGDDELSAIVGVVKDGAKFLQVVGSGFA